MRNLVGNSAEKNTKEYGLHVNDKEPHT